MIVFKMQNDLNRNNEKKRQNYLPFIQLYWYTSIGTCTDTGTGFMEHYIFSRYPHKCKCTHYDCLQILVHSIIRSPMIQFDNVFIANTHRCGGHRHLNIDRGHRERELHTHTHTPSSSPPPQPLPIRYIYHLF